MTIQKKTALTALALAAVAAAAVTTAALADRRGGMHGEGGGMMMLNFAAMDADKDGKITEAEITAHRQARIAGADANADGKLSADELAAMQLQSMQTRAADRAARMIDAMDGDGDGLLTAAEMAAGPSPLAMFKRLDADGDGAVTQAEVDAAMTMMRGHRGKHGGHGIGMGQGQGMDMDMDAD